MFRIEVDVEGFDRAAEEAARDVENRILPDLVGAIGLHVDAGKIERSPVLTGRYRESHSFTVNGYDESAVPEGTYAAPDRLRSSGKARSLKKGDWVGLQTNLPYSGAIEWGGVNRAPVLVSSRAVDAAVAWANRLGEIDGNAVGLVR